MLQVEYSALCKFNFLLAKQKHEGLPEPALSCPRSWDLPPLQGPAPPSLPALVCCHYVSSVGHLWAPPLQQDGLRLWVSGFKISSASVCARGRGYGKKEGAKLLEAVDTPKPADPKMPLVMEFVENFHHGYPRMQ